LRSIHRTLELSNKLIEAYSIARDGDGKNVTVVTRFTKDGEVIVNESNNGKVATGVLINSAKTCCDKFNCFINID